MADQRQNDQDPLKKTTPTRHGLQIFLTVSHLVALLLVLAFASHRYPKTEQIQEQSQKNSEKTVVRAQLMELLDKIVRYQYYYRDIYGQFTRDIRRLGVPRRLSIGTSDQVLRHYEISVVERSQGRLLVLALEHPKPNAKRKDQRQEQVTINEQFSISANFPLVHSTRSYLLSEASRVLKLQSQQIKVAKGLSEKYWRFERGLIEDGFEWQAVGTAAPVLGEVVKLDSRELASIFGGVQKRLKTRIYGDEKERGNRSFDKAEISETLEQARLAQHIHFKETGTFAELWIELDQVTDFRFIERFRNANNVRLEKVELDDSGYLLGVKGTRGDLLGELFTIDQDGVTKQVRYTEVFVKELRKSTKLLQKSGFFQISVVPDEGNDRKPASKK